MGVSLGAKPSPNPDPALDPNLQTRYRSMVRAVRPSPELDREVLASARRLRSRSGARPSETASIRALVEKPRTRRPSLSRRAFVATAFGLGAVALAIGIPTALRRPDEKVAGLSADRPRCFPTPTPCARWGPPAAASRCWGAPRAPCRFPPQAWASCRLTAWGRTGT